MALRSSLFCLFFCCSALVAAAANSGPSDIFNDQDANSVKQLVLQAQNPDGTFSDIKVAHHAVASLAHLKVDLPKKTEVCSQAKKILSEPKPTIAAVYHAVNVAKLLGCSEKASAQVIGVIEAALASENLHDIYYAVRATTTLAQHITVNKEKLVAAADRVKDLFDTDGTVLPHKDATTGDVYNTGLAFQILGVLHSTVILPEDTIEGVGASWVESVVALGEETDDTLSFATNDRLALEVTETVLRGFLDLHSAKLLDLTKDQTVQIAEFFVKNKSPVDVDSAYYLLSGLNLLSTNDQYVPLVLTLLTKSVSSAAKGADGNVKVRITNVLGHFATKARVVLTKANAVNDIKLVLFTNQELTPENSDASNTVYTVNFLAAKPEPGLYDLDFKATPAAKNFVGIDSVVESVAVTTSAVPAQLEIAVGDSKEEDDIREAEKSKLEYPETLKKKLAASQSQHIHISFRVKNGVTGRPIASQQAFVKLTNTKSNTEAILLPKFVNKKYRLDIDVANTEDFHGETGDYKIEVIIADPAFTNPTLWNVGNVQLTFTEKPTPRPSWHAPLPVIEHVFRPDEKRAPTSISTIFTGLVFAPVLVLLILVARVGINFKNFPTGSASLFALAFTGCLFAYAGLVALFWFQINLLTTLKYLTVLGVVTIFVGNRTLQYLAALRTKRQ